jgi:Na+/H+-dicarboxylate symporter
MTKIALLVFFTMTSICFWLGFVVQKLVFRCIHYNIDGASVLNSLRSQGGSLQVGQIVSDASQKKSIFLDMFNGLFPSNLVNSFLTENLIHIIFCAIFFAIATKKIQEQKHQELIQDINASLFSLFDICVKNIMKLNNIAIFSIVFWLFFTQELGFIKSLGVYLSGEFLTFSSIAFLFIPLTLFLFFGINPIRFIKKIFPIQYLAFITSSGASVMPKAMEVCKEKLGCNEKTVNFIYPIALTVNMNGGAIHFGSIISFFCIIFNHELTFGGYITAYLVGLSASVGTAPVPGATLILMSGVLAAVGLPVEAVAIVFAIDRISDMTRTLVNLTGDVFVTMFVDIYNKTFNRKIFDKN